MNVPFLVPYPEVETEFTPITPRFPNWEKSFISGAGSPLYETAHFASQALSELISTHVKFKGLALGPPGHVHGGATAGIIDEVMGICVWHQAIACVTQTLELRYLKPVPLSIDGRIFTQIKCKTERSVEIFATIYDQDRNYLVTARGLFHRLRPEQLAKFRTQ